MSKMNLNFGVRLVLELRLVFCENKGINLFNVELLKLMT